MKLKRLLVQNYRNIPFLDFTPHDCFNVVYGKNGAGKTSLLEAISYLGLGRSFRQAKYQSLIKDGQDFFSISADINQNSSNFNESVGIKRNRARGQSLEIAINGNRSNRLIDLIDKLSIQVIHPQGIDLILEGPELRRNYIDWGVYYSYPEFKEHWFRYKKFLANRNTLLKDRAQSDTIQFWDEMLCESSEIITNFREQYLELLTRVLKEKLKVFLPQFDFESSFSKGWENGLPLRSVLDSNLEKDRILGYTFYGCHRADLKIKCNNFSASETLSRGQLKLLVCAMRLAQGSLLKQQIGKSCVYLIDDLSSELDPISREILLNDLKDCKSQVFLTNISKDIQTPSDALYIDIEKEINGAVM